MSEPPGQALLLGERGQGLGRLHLGFAHGPPPSRSPAGEGCQPEGDKRFIRGKAPLSPNGLLAPPASAELLPRELPVPFSTSRLKCWKKCGPAEESCWPWPSGNWCVKPS